MQFAFNNPLSFNDPTGLCADCPLPTQYLDEITVTAGRISDPGRFTSANIGFSFPRPDFGSLFRSSGFVTPSLERYPLSSGTIISITPVYPEQKKSIPVYTIEGGEIKEIDWSALLGYTGVISGITERSITRPLSYDLMTLKQLSKIGGAAAAATSFVLDGFSLQSEFQRNRTISYQSKEKFVVNTGFTMIGLGEGLGLAAKGLGFTISAVYFAGSQLKKSDQYPYGAWSIYGQGFMNGVRSLNRQGSGWSSAWNFPRTYFIGLGNSFSDTNYGIYNNLGFKFTTTAPFITTRPFD